MITKRAAAVVKEMLPKEGQAAVDRGSAAYRDILEEAGAGSAEELDTLDGEVTEVLEALGRGRFSVLDGGAA